MARTPRPAGARPTPTVNVRPLHDRARQFVRHPNGTGFSDNPDGTAWPNDQFTQRRIIDGDIEIVGLPEGAMAPSPPPETTAAVLPSDTNALDTNALPRLAQAQSTMSPPGATDTSFSLASPSRRKTTT